MVAPKCDFLGKDIISGEEISLGILEDSMCVESLDPLASEIVVNLTSDVVVLVVDVGRALQSSFGILVVPCEVECQPQTEGACSGKAELD